MPKIRTKPVSNSSWLRQREIGFKFPLGHNDRFYKTLYSSIQPCTSWDHRENVSSAMHGGVFNLEYSPDGSLLLAACEKRSILMFDPLCRRLIHAIDNAHNDCVNCVRFLDQRMFATCSDDSTVALWDARNLKQRIRTLQGHSNWVKNIEFSPSDGLLLTSGFDGSIYTWDINSFTENSFLYNRVFHTNGLMRTRLSPDATKMLICTTSGYLIIIHNLQLSTLSQDLAGFKPNMYRLMQLSQTTIPVAASFTHLFSHSRSHNRVEFLTDFPVGDDAEVISSLQVHPQGWCALSRNVSTGEKSEWTCVHDIQETDAAAQIEEQVKDNEDSASHFNDLSVEEYEDDHQPQPSRSGTTSPFVIDSVSRARIVQEVTDIMTNSFVSTDATQPIRPSRTSNWQDIPRRNSRSQSRSGALPRLERNIVRTNFGVVEVSSIENSLESRLGSGSEAEERRRQANRLHESDNEGDNLPGGNSSPGDNTEDYRLPRQNSQLSDLRRRNVIDGFELHVSSTDVWEALVAIREARHRREREREFHSSPGERRDWLPRSSSGVSVSMPPSHTVVILGDRARAQGQNRQGSQTMYAIPRNHKIHQNTPRLTHYIEEPNVGSGYIKELCFSSDGRLICSPFGYGVRLLAFSGDCQDLSNCVPPGNESVKLHELATNVSHSDIVVSTKFSPKHCLLVSGCLSGQITWHQPVV
ncbi:DDB1- and CUL4-associated factor 10 homolog [Neodiprion pinetum]|uniref:DDB1- and CUL4-associated factor 10 n=1 Tax=Neodiprion lecontei TaxID=441921 RepID=A0A6J0BRY4_NEOLC|nr:DDB1- and CUL4-associated factor 10 [Neodiprion lecontei]XP_046416738.1 DDB1- and CUL4-associated factor 10 [Neodiprion fabricii]XP_046472784.1 DDB1- and CUL4-associated factor 10 [Neodiprion pinetum]XP_046612032.1 DDB1- and CUL4-associated factor 10 [Neodiprion virginianus]